MVTILTAMGEEACVRCVQIRLETIVLTVAAGRKLPSRKGSCDWNRNRWCALDYRYASSIQWTISSNQWESSTFQCALNKRPAPCYVDGSASRGQSYPTAAVLTSRPCSVQHD